MGVEHVDSQRTSSKQNLMNLAWASRTDVFCYETCQFITSLMKHHIPVYAFATLPIIRSDFAKLFTVYVYLIIVHLGVLFYEDKFETDFGNLKAN